MAIKVSLREKSITGERVSLYLDFYPHVRNPKTGALTRREFLGYYLYKDKDVVKKEIEKLKNLSQSEKTNKELNKLKEIHRSLKPLTPLQKLHNAKTLELAESIRLNRENELNKPEVYTEFERERLMIKALGEKDFLAYYIEVRNKSQSKKNYEISNATLKFLEDFSTGDLKFADVTQKFCNDFKEYLLTTKSRKSEKATLTQNSAGTYFNNFKSVLKRAYKDGYLQTNLSAFVQPIPPTDTNIEFLTEDEVYQLSLAECENPLLKRAALFSALTGLRHSDIKKLMWGEIRQNEDGHFISFKQKKTKGFEVLPISDEAFELLGEPQEPTENVFSGLFYSAHQNLLLDRWVKKAGITRHIRFHSFRHTNATLLLQKTNNLYLVSKMLGHRKVGTTQRYAKVIDATKREAANSLKLNIKNNGN